MRRIEFRYYEKRMMVEFGNPLLMKNTTKDYIQPIVMQFTGLYDCNGNKIWEGDIVRQANAIMEGEIDNSSYIRFGIVYWCEGDMGFAIDWNDNSCQFSDFTPGSYEVVGNIYQNEELLEEIKQCEK